MSGIVTLTFAPEAVDYRLGAGGHGCGGDAQFSYHANGSERPLRWIGSGLAAHGLSAGAEFVDGDEDRARALMRGVDPATGEQVVRPRAVVFDDAKVDVTPLLAAAVVAQSRGVVVSAKSHQRMMTAMQKAAERARGGVALYRADEAGVVADALGLDVDEVWGEGVFEAASANLVTTEMRVVDGQAVEQVVPRRKVVGNAGYDYTFTLPKSTSVLLAFTDAATADAVESTLYEQVEASFGWLEARTAYGMRGKHGRDKNGTYKAASTVDGDGFRGWTMVHRSARPVDGSVVGDPHWHVHTTFANMTRLEDGTYGTVAAGGRDLMRHMRATAALYEAMVRRSMSERFGVQFDRRESGQWEIVGIPDATIALFSKRRDQVTSVLSQMGFEEQDVTAAVARFANAKSREAKGTLTSAADATLQQLWRQEAAEAGFEVDAITDAAFTGTVNVMQRLPREALLAQVAARLLSAEDGLTAHKRRFTRLEAMAAVADALPGGVGSAVELEELTDGVLAQAGFVELPDAVYDVSAQRGAAAARHMRDAEVLTTADVVSAETFILDRARDDAPIYAATSVEQLDAGVRAAETEQGFEFSGEQLEAVARLALDGRAVSTLLGPPGTGKTTIMRGVRHAMAAAGLRVGGAATAAIAAGNLEREAGIASRTVAQYMATPQLLDELDVLVLDEANLTEDRGREALYRACAQRNVRIIEAGDSLQLRGVGVGSLFRRVHELVRGPVLAANRRQRDGLDRAAIEAWREGQFREALALWSGRGSLVTTDTSISARAQVLQQWQCERASAPDAATEMRGLLMLAGTNAAVDLLNDGAQEVRRRSGELGTQHEYVREDGRAASFAVGDFVVLRRNDRGQELTSGDEVLNGRRGQITALDDDGTMRVEWHSDDEDAARSAVLSADYVRAGGVRLGYALTVHAAEGLTVGQRWSGQDGEPRGGTVLVAAAGMDDPLLHVATSRHTRGMTLYAALDEWEDDQEQHERGVPRDAQEQHERIVAAIAQSAARSRVDANDRPTLADLGDEDERRAWLEWSQRWRTGAEPASSPSAEMRAYENVPEGELRQVIADTERLLAAALQAQHDGPSPREGEIDQHRERLDAARGELRRRDVDDDGATARPSTAEVREPAPITDRDHGPSPVLDGDADAYDRALVAENPYMGRPVAELSMLRAQAQLGVDRSTLAFDRARAALAAPEDQPGRHEREAAAALQVWIERSEHLERAAVAEERSAAAIAASVKAADDYTEHGKVRAGRGRAKAAWEAERARLHERMVATGEVAVQARLAAGLASDRMPPKEHWAQARLEADAELARHRDLLEQARATDAHERTTAHETAARAIETRAEHQKQLDQIADAVAAHRGHQQQRPQHEYDALAPTLEPDRPLEK
ncbi:MAG: MobF family relaxase [Cumulibacter sp.]